ncbi:RsmB/NOP family class I SAM-dependent RNA methyltransferase [Ignisphaera sp. 4213-co]|uniref:RsmB/NOP family class I SAM-dependent RNA methyltransferase n=1 Tax=Ignisphaera cupida TaxID=3050454 RepID=A0ABD4ZA60_9CREN|nr:RsmB/NOP family class I SAM-dependent RNA methyltransferase [Ignisphaera sp. 4213-co]MDK6029448.1 RsmB/NOP family class I SAM-dependent RNA methyltransferase [Ignisphaera sp. 4213-co]
MNIDVIVSVLANVLYTILRKKVSSRKAFSYTCKRFGCGKALLEREFLYKLSQEFVSNYYKLLYIVERSSKVRNPSHRLLARAFIYMWLVERGERVDSKLRKAIERDFPRINEFMLNIDEPWAMLSYPKWLFDKLSTVMPIDEVVEMLKAMNKRVLWIRINTLKIDVDKALKILSDEGVEYEADKNIPFLVRVVKTKKPIRTLELFKNGSIIIQDKASVLTVLALDPKPDMLIYDFAAAPGIKTSLIMQLTENKARVVAFDLSRRRLEAMKMLLNRYGVDTSRIELVLADSTKIALSKKADAILVDATCSSSGAISKDPAIKIILRDSRIPQKMSIIQTEMLLNALKHGERVVYAVCSILPDEGEEVVEKVFSKETTHKLVDPQIPASRGYPKYSIWNKVRRTLPHIDKSEGFFIARLER